MPRHSNSSDLRRSVGQLLIIGFDGTEMSPGLAALLTRLQPAGVILFARNITGGEQTHKLLKDCQACVSTPLFTAVDMEGGRVDRFRNVIGRTPSAADVFSTGDRKLFRQHGKVDRRILPDVGIQHRLRARSRPGIRSVKNSDEFPRRFSGSETGGSLCPGISQGIARRQCCRLRQTLSRPGRGQSRHPPGTSLHQQALEKDLGGRLVSLPNPAPGAADGPDRTRQLSCDHARRQPGIAVEEMDHRRSPRRRSATGAWSFPTISRWEAY